LKQRAFSKILEYYFVLKIVAHWQNAKQIRLAPIEFYQQKNKSIEQNKMKIYVKNMACESCKIFVKDTLKELGISLIKVELGEIETREDVTDDEKIKLNSKIKKAGMELLEKKQGVLIEKIRKCMIDYVAHFDKNQNLKFSVLLSEELNHSYTYLSNCFSEVEATSIEQYIIALKIERIKELIIFDEYTFSEIAHLLNYSSAAHLSTQFKKVTGLTPSHFKALKERRRITIQNI